MAPWYWSHSSGRWVGCCSDIRSSRWLERTPRISWQWGAEHSFFGDFTLPSCRSGQREVQTAKTLVVEQGGALGCKQRYILDDFLSLDSGQPSLVDFLCKLVLPKEAPFSISMEWFPVSAMAGIPCNNYTFKFYSWLICCNYKEGKEPKWKRDGHILKRTFPMKI